MAAQAVRSANTGEYSGPFIFDSPVLLVDGACRARETFVQLCSCLKERTCKNGLPCTVRPHQLSLNQLSRCTVENPLM